MTRSAARATPRRTARFARALAACLAATPLLAAPAGYLWGALAAFYVAFMTGVFVGVWIYVAWSHLNENEAELRSIRGELRRLDAADAASARSDG